MSKARPRPQHTIHSIAKEGTAHAEQKSYKRQAIDTYEISKWRAIPEALESQISFATGPKL